MKKFFKYTATILGISIILASFTVVPIACERLIGGVASTLISHAINSIIFIGLLIYHSERVKSVEREYIRDERILNPKNPNIIENDSKHISCKTCSMSGSSICDDIMDEGLYPQCGVFNIKWYSTFEMNLVYALLISNFEKKTVIYSGVIDDESLKKLKSQDFYTITKISDNPEQYEISMTAEGRQ